MWRLSGAVLSSGDVAVGRCVEIDLCDDRGGGTMAIDEARVYTPHAINVVCTRGECMVPSACVGVRAGRKQTYFSHDMT